MTHEELMDTVSWRISSPKRAFMRQRSKLAMRFSRFLADEKLKHSNSETHICMASHIFVWVLSQPLPDSARKRENHDMCQSLTQACAVISPRSRRNDSTGFRFCMFFKERRTDGRFLARFCFLNTMRSRTDCTELHL